MMIKMTSMTKEEVTSTPVTSPPPTLYSQLNEQLNIEIEAPNKENTIPTRNVKSVAATSYQSMSSYYFGSSAKTDTNGDNTKISVSIIGDAFVDLFCFLNDGSSGVEGGRLPGLGADVRINQPVTPVPGGSGINTATHLASLSKQFPFMKQSAKDTTEGDGNASSETSEENKQEEQVKDDEQMDVTLQTVVNENDGYGRLLLNHAKQSDFQIINCRREEPKKKSSDDEDAEEAVHKSSIPSTGHCIVLVTQNERSFITHLGVMEAFQPAHTILHELVQCRSADPTFINQHHHIHIAGYYNTPKFHSANALKKRINLIRERRRTQSHGMYVYTTTISLTPQYDATEKWDTDELFNLLPLVDFLILNLLEACKICKFDIPEEEDFESKANGTEQRLLFLKLADYLDEQSPQTYVVVTLGKAGAVLLYGGDIVYTHQSPKQYNAPLDSTGAGDAFVAGFLFGTMNWRRYRQHDQVHEIGSVLKEAGGWTEAIEIGMEWGCIAGTACVMKAGASVPSSKQEIEELLYYDAEENNDSNVSESDGVVVELGESYDSKFDSDYDSDDASSDDASSDDASSDEDSDEEDSEEVDSEEEDSEEEDSEEE